MIIYVDTLPFTLPRQLMEIRRDGGYDAPCRSPLVTTALAVDAVVGQVNETVPEAVGICTVGLCRQAAKPLFVQINPSVITVSGVWGSARDSPGGSLKYNSLYYPSFDFCPCVHGEVKRSCGVNNGV